jgi:hypothetical protein
MCAYCDGVRAETVSLSRGYDFETIGGIQSRPRVRISTPSVSGFLPVEAVRRVLLRNLGQVTHCYEQGLAVEPQLRGRVTVRFVIGGTGTVLGANVVENTLAVPYVGTCVANAIRRWIFPGPAGGGIAFVNVPLQLGQ